MVKEYQSLKVTISQIGDKLFRSRADRFPRGASVGAGHDFKLDLETFRPFLRALRSRSVSPPTALEDFGRDLFDRVFTDSVRDRYSEVREAARRQEHEFRICLSIQALDLVSLPWELLHDGSGFLAREHGYAIVRVIDELQGTKSSFGHVEHVLVAAANPADGYDRFDADAHLAALKTNLTKAHKTFEIVYPASKKAIRDALKADRFDAFYFVGHGVHMASGGRLVCQRQESDGAEELESGALAGWLREAHRMRVVYLNACSSAAHSTGESPFYGVAQRLMLDGDVAAVVAMPIDIPQAAALPMAESFFEEMTQASPEDAVLKMRRDAEGEGDWAIPVVYSYVDAPEQFEKNCLAALVGASATDDCELVVPSFVKAVPRGEDPLPFDSKGRYIFPGETFARSDIQAALSVRDLLIQVVPAARIKLVPQHEWKWEGKTNLFLFGSKSNPAVSSVLREFSNRFKFHYERDRWTIIDAERGLQYSMQAPHQLSPGAYSDTEDFGVIQKLSAAGEPTKFVIAGLGSRATEGCGRYLTDNWRRLLNEFGQKAFAIVLRFAPGLGTRSDRVG